MWEGPDQCVEAAVDWHGRDFSVGSCKSLIASKLGQWL